jgi:hypothetical protein
MNEQDTVALMIDLPDNGLKIGHVGTIVEILDDGVYEVEFADLNGDTDAMVTLKVEQLMVLRYEPIDKAG